MSIAKAAATTPKRTVYKGPQCTVGTLLDGLDDKDRAALLNIFDRHPNDKPTNEWISDFLVADGHPRIMAQTINRHRLTHKSADNCMRRL